MNLDTYLKQQRGLASDLARALGVTPTVVSHWASGERPIPPARCPSIERATSGAVTCEELRPDVDWAFIRGTEPRASAGAMLESDPDAGRIVPPVEAA